MQPLSSSNLDPHRACFARKRTTRLALRLAIVLPAAFGLAACTAQTHPVAVDSKADVVLDTAPVNVYAYPHAVYRDEDVYYVDGRWYRRHGPHWVYYRSEPPELIRHRGHVEQAPSARRVVEPGPWEAISVR